MRQIAAGLLVLCGATAASAQAPGSASLSYEALSRASAGAWADYTMDKDGQAHATMRYALVEKSAKAMAVEVSSTTPPLVMRMDLVANGPTAWRLERMRMQIGGGQVTDAQIPEGADRLIRKDGNLGTLVGKETIKTPAGSFECKHYKQELPQGEADVWMSDKALPGGIVQSRVAALGIKMTLTATGSGAAAKSK
jgi:hypothetical protein